MSKRRLAQELGISRSALYYQPVMPTKDWLLKCEIEKVLREHPSYGYRRVALHLQINKKRTQRVMKLFGMKAFRRRGRKPKKKADSITQPYDNLLLTTYPAYPGHTWVSDFTYIPFQGKFVYLATVMDLFTRKIVGFSILTSRGSQLVIQALLSAIHNHSRPIILHSDQGREYASKPYLTLLQRLGIEVSMSRRGCPWENGYQESFYSQFKVDLGDPGRFSQLGELVYAIYKTIHTYNHTRIHSALKMPPALFAQIHQLTNVEKVS